jgi:DNA-binding transcriptional ArsR family regulator
LNDWHRGTVATEIDASPAARLKAASDPTRIRMGLLLLDDGHTVKELATALDVPATRLYYHVKILEQHGLVEVVERRMVSGIEERRYRAIAEAWAFGPNDPSPSPDEMVAMLRATLSAVQGELEVVLHDNDDSDAAVPVFTLTDLFLTREELEEVHAFIQDINDRHAADRVERPSDAQRYHFLFAGWLRPEVRSAS